MYLMAQPSAHASNLASHPLNSSVEVMGKLTVTLVNWRRMLVRVTGLLQSRTRGFAKVSENGTHFRGHFYAVSVSCCEISVVLFTIMEFFNHTHSLLSGKK